jgi:hypothetical protein
MNVEQVIDAVNKLAIANHLPTVDVGSPASMADVDAVEKGLGVRIPTDVRDFYLHRGRIDGWGVSSTVPVHKLLTEAESLTRTLLQHKRLKNHPVVERLKSGAKALVVGVTEGDSVGYTFIVVDQDTKPSTNFWFFWRDEYNLESAGTSLVEWLDNLLGFAIQAAIQKHSEQT